MASNVPNVTYQAVKVLTAAQYAKLQNGFIQLPAGVVISNAVPNANATYYTVTFQGKGLGSFALFQAIPCSMTAGVAPEAAGDTLTFAASGIYHGTGPLAGGLPGASF